MHDTPSVLLRIRKSAAGGLASGARTALYLIRIMVPVSLAVALLKWSGVLSWGASFLAPAMGLLGLPGEAAVVLLSSALLNVYSAIAVIETLPLSTREITILAIMCLTAHNLIIETAVMRKSGSSAFKMVVLRIGWALALGYLFNLVLPAGRSAAIAAADSAVPAAAFWPSMAGWGLSTLRLIAKIVVLVVAIMIGQRLMEEFRVMDFLSRVTSPAMRVFGLSENASFLWIVINVVGYAYGAAIIMERVKDGKMKPQEADLFNHHAGLCHSLLEDTTMFLAIGVSLFWITVPRLAAALAVVWFERARRHRFRRSFKVGTV
ncbi:MAG: transporter [Spirochaetes bacterium]|nr:transporter [Spirochaetota bacterium]MBU1082058.1 transporter [Spirochaetota bacterium]